MSPSLADILRHTWLAVSAREIPLRRRLSARAASRNEGIWENCCTKGGQDWGEQGRGDKAFLGRSQTNPWQDHQQVEVPRFCRSCFLPLAPALTGQTISETDVREVHCLRHPKASDCHFPQSLPKALHHRSCGKENQKESPLALSKRPDVLLTVPEGQPTLSQHPLPKNNNGSRDSTIPLLLSQLILHSKVWQAKSN